MFLLTKFKRIISLTAVFCIAASLLAGCGKKNVTPPEKPTDTKSKEPTVITFGTWNERISDPEAVDPVTGKPLMDPERLFASQKAMDAVLDELNVKIKWKSYAEVSEREYFLKTVLANDPFSDLALLRGGSPGVLLSQNIIQKFDDYIDIFSDDNDKWMLQDPMLGHYFFLTNEFKFMSSWPIVYNITYLQKVDTLKENGKTILPTDLWKQDKWTWSTFHDYLSKVSTYYENKKPPVRPERPIAPFLSEGRYPVYGAAHSNGAAMYNNDKFQADTPEFKEAAKYIEGLVNENLIVVQKNYQQEVIAFKNGEAVFFNMQEDISNGAAQELSKRGEAMGVIPFPRPDDMSKDDPRYQQHSETRDTFIALKGIPKDKLEIALKAYRLYFSTIMKTAANSDKAIDFFENNAQSEALRLGFDVANETYGKDLLEAFKGIAVMQPNDYANNLGLYNTLQYDVIRASLMKENNAPEYSINVEQHKNVILDDLKRVKSLISTDELVDNMPPNLQLINKDIPIALGTDLSKIDWGKYIQASDGIDGDIASDKIVVDTSKVNLDEVSKYPITASVKDAAGNEKKANYTVLIYDPQNKLAPTLVAKAEYRKIKIDEDVSKISWGRDFIDVAESADKFDIRNHVTADVSTLDVTKAGTYDITLTATDYAGNKTELKIPITVE